jgi:hypothetical protein
MFKLTTICDIFAVSVLPLITITRNTVINAYLLVSGDMDVNENVRLSNFTFRQIKVKKQHLIIFLLHFIVTLGFSIMNKIPTLNWA